MKAINNEPDKWILKYNTQYEGCCFRHADSISTRYFMPTYKIGEVLYIKEPVADYFVGLIPYVNGVFGDRQVATAYKYGLPEHKAMVYAEEGPMIIPSEGLEWKNKMFVGADKARAYIRITGTRCERLFDISASDCLKEGVEIAYTSEASCGGNIDSHMYRDYTDKTNRRVLNVKNSYFSLFRFANEYSKNKEIRNEWVFVYDYVLCDKNGKEI